MTRTHRRTPLFLVALVMLGLAVVAAPAEAQSPAIAGSTYIAAPPSRVLDTRDGTGGVSAALGSGGVLAFRPAADHPDATAVVLNVVAITPSQAGFLTVYPDGSPKPATSNVDFSAGQTTANLVMVPVANGVIDVFNHFGNTDVLADLEGYYVPSTSGTGFTASTPIRKLDTRDGTGRGGAVGPIGPGGTISLNLPSLPPDATSAVLNLTATNGTAPSVLTAYAAGPTRPNTSNLNFDAGQTLANLTVVSLTSRTLTIWNLAGSVDVVADLVGYYTSGSGSTFTPITPTPMFNTLDGTGAHGVAPLGSGDAAKAIVQVAGSGVVPANATAVLVHVAVTNATQTSFLTAYADSTSRPSTSNINFAAGQIVSNSMIVPVVNGAIDLWNSNGNVDIVADLSGYYMPVD